MKVLLLIPFNQEFTDISNIIQDAVVKTNNQFIHFDDIFSPNSDAMDIFIEQIEKADLVIADISGNNPNVMYELGIVKLLGKPTVVIAQKNEIIPHNIRMSEFILVYDRERLTDSLYSPVIRFLRKDNINDFITKKVTKSVKKPMVFLSYSHVDVEYLERLKIHLKPFEKKGLINVWSDTKIKAGEKWKEQIEKALEESVAAILLISADFLASDFIVDNELPPLLKSAEEKGKLILPVVLKPCRFSKDENLSKFQAVNNPIIPLSKMDENSKEEVYVKIADYIADLVR
ncbi:MAG: TIR domain-containing protein [Bacteroidetes bacterium]|nr:TIR domain-containing protein [Bacteroidota bacterium]